MKHTSSFTSSEHSYHCTNKHLTILNQRRRGDYKSTTSLESPSNFIEIHSSKSLKLNKNTEYSSESPTKFAFAILLHVE